MILAKILFYSFFVLSAIRLLYYVLLFSKTYKIRTERHRPEYLPPVSIVVCARNEAANIRDNLKLLLIQQYPNFEVVVVDDQSDDDTLKELQLYQKRNKNLRVLSVKKNFEKPWPGKKYALYQGVKAATYEHIVVTDADCRPDSFNWLTGLMSHYMKGTRLVLGYGPLNRHSGFVNKLARYENFHTALQYYSYGLAGMPYMGVGRNMSFLKSDFLSWKPEPEQQKVASGDDDLFVNAIANARNTELSADKETFMYSEPALTYIDWLKQKTRHLRSGAFYRPQHQLLLGVYGVATTGMYVAFLGLILTQYELKTVVPVLLLWQLLSLALTLRAFKIFQSMNLLLWYPLLDMVFAIQGLILYLLVLVNKKDSWK